MAGGRSHRVATTAAWTSNRRSGMSSYMTDGRDHDIRIAGKPVNAGSSDDAFRSHPTQARTLHVKAQAKCVVARLVNFLVFREAIVKQT